MSLSPDRLTTFGAVDGYRVARSFGYAYGQAQRKKDVLRTTFRTIGQLLGVAPAEYLTDAERARGECLERLCARAAELGANGVIGLRFQTTETADGSTRVVAFGEAVELVREERA